MGFQPAGEWKWRNVVNAMSDDRLTPAQDRILSRRRASGMNDDD
jgi:hypothetical protein